MYIVYYYGLFLWILMSTQTTFLNLPPFAFFRRRIRSGSRWANRWNFVGQLWDGPPGFLDHLSKLSLILGLFFVYLVFQDGPHVLDWVQIRRVGWPITLGVKSPTLGQFFFSLSPNKAQLWSSKGPNYLSILSYMSKCLSTKPGIISPGPHRVTQYLLVIMSYSDRIHIWMIDII